jgi:hypothetical protein
MVTIPKHVLDLQLKGPQLVSIHAKTVSKQSILTQRDELQSFVDAWGLDNPEVLFIAYLDDVCKKLMKSMRNRSQTTHSEKLPAPI